MRALVVAFALTTTACNLLVGFDQPAERDAQCTDGVDNDGNGLRDCEEDACAASCTTCGAGIVADGRSFDPATGHCYLGFIAQQDVISANESCLELGGYLAVPDDAAEDAIVRAAAVGPASLGLQDPDGDGFYGFRQVTGDLRTEYLNFTPGQPDAPPYGPICVGYDGGAPTWEDHDCLSLRPYVCELEPQPCGDFVRQAAEECDDGNLIDTDGCTSECRDVDECAAGSDACSPDADCLNEPWRVGNPGYACQCRNGFIGDGFSCTPLPPQPVFVAGEPVPISAVLENCTTQTSYRGRKLAMDPFGALYAVMMCSGEVHATASVDGGLTWSPPQLLAIQVEEVAVVGMATGRAAVVTWQSNSEIQIRQTRDFGATWSSPGTVAFTTGGLPALGVATDGARVYVSELSFSGALQIHGSLDDELQTFTTASTVTATDGEVLVDPLNPQQVWAVGAAPGYQVMVSTDNGQTFPPLATTPPGAQTFSDWAIGGGTIAVVGEVDEVSVIPVTAPDTSTTVTKLRVGVATERTLTVDPFGAVIVAQTSASGGVEVVRLAPGGTIFDPSVGVDFIGQHPGIAAVFGGLVAVVYTGGGSVHVAIVDP